ncbi:MAG TPA: GtrA family protein [Prolixibacteraceae bacterium]|nr:GtrA family protein [Prolixibacteraceae bacterium]
MGLFWKFFKFSVVGFSGLFVDFGITFLLKEKLKIPKYVANGCGFVVAATSNYFLNRWWTFESHNPHVEKEFLSFFLISLIGLGINTLIIWILVSKFKWNFYLGKLAAIVVTTLWNFVANLLITFSGIL